MAAKEFLRENLQLLSINFKAMNFQNMIYISLDHDRNDSIIYFTHNTIFMVDMYSLEEI